MPKIEFLASSAGAMKTIDMPDGGDLLEACDAFLAPVPFSCRSATCATCEVQVVEGAHLLEPPNEDEADLLEILGNKKGRRIACQARIAKGDGLIRLRPVAVGPPRE